MTRPSTALFFGFALTGLVVGCEQQRELSAEEIRALFSGKTVEGYHEIYQYTFRSYYEPDGTYRSYQDASTQPRNAKWWIEGKDMCIQWASQSIELCRRIIKVGGIYKKVMRKNGKTKKVVVTYKRFRTGNPNNL